MIKKNIMKNYFVYSFTIKLSDDLLQDALQLFKFHNMYFVHDGYLCFKIRSVAKPKS